MFLYFAYGSVLSRRHVGEWAGEHGVDARLFARGAPAVLRGYSLTFDVESRFWGGRVANLREDKEFLEKISPIRQVDKIKCPMMVIHGANDPRVPIDEAEQIVAALKKRDVPVTYLRYEDEGHGLAKLKNRLDAFPKMIAFLDKYLK